MRLVSEVCTSCLPFQLESMYHESSSSTTTTAWEEPSMDQYQCREKLLKNFQDHWSIWMSPGKCMDQWRSKFSESFSLDRYWSIECSSLTAQIITIYIITDRHNHTHTSSFSQQAPLHCPSHHTWDLQWQSDTDNTCSQWSRPSPQDDDSSWLSSKVFPLVIMRTPARLAGVWAAMCHSDSKRRGLLPNRDLRRPGLSDYHLSQKLLHYSTLVLDNWFWAPKRKDYITEIVLELFLGAVILTGDLSDICTVISGEWGLWEN